MATISLYFLPLICYNPDDNSITQHNGTKQHITAQKGAKIMGGYRTETIRQDIVSMIGRMTPHELSMMYSLARHIDTRKKETPRQ